MDDITFCPLNCDNMNCVRNSKNIQDRTIPHSYSIELPDDCPNKISFIKTDEADEETEHIVQECICLKCFYRWIDVRPVGTRLQDLECPLCGLRWYVIGTGEPIDADDNLTK